MGTSRWEVWDSIARHIQRRSSVHTFVWVCAYGQFFVHMYIYIYTYTIIYYNIYIYMSVYIHICAHKPEQVLHKFDKNVARCGPVSEPPRTVLTQPCLISKSTMQAAAYLVCCHCATTSYIVGYPLQGTTLARFQDTFTESSFALNFTRYTQLRVWIPLYFEVYPFSKEPQKPYRTVWVRTFSAPSSAPISMRPSILQRVRQDLGLDVTSAPHGNKRRHLFALEFRDIEYFRLRPSTLKPETVNPKTPHP